MPSWTTITKPATGTATKKSLIDAIIDNETYLYGQLANSTGDKTSVVNGSFEVDGDADGVPDGWTKALLTGGAVTLTGNGLADTVCQSGARAIKFVHPGGGGNGGGTLTSTTGFEVTPTKPLCVTWQWYSTLSTLNNLVDISWYTAANAFISTTNLATVSTGNPSAWALQSAIAYPPATARYAKLIFTGGATSGSTAGTMYLDNVAVLAIDRFTFQHSVEYEGSGTTATTHQWRCPTGVNTVRVTAFGGGGSGGTGGGTAGGGGGGSGEMAQSVISVTPGTDYAISIGGGGSGGAGGDTTWASTVIVAKGGSVGVSNTSSAAGGAGGTGGTGDYKISGNPGRAAAVGNPGSSGGYGGDSINGLGGGKAATSTAGAAPSGSKGRGAGGGGGSQSATTAGNGAAGSIIIEW